VIDSVVTERARQFLGAAALFKDEEGDKCLEPTWDAAIEALVDAAMAFGAPGVLDSEGHSILTAPWRSVIGPDPVDVHANA
jgi:hypothetical protein